MPVDHIAKIREYGDNLVAEEHGGVGAHTDSYCLAIIAHSILADIPEAPEPEAVEAAEAGVVDDGKTLRGLPAEKANKTGETQVETNPAPEPEKEAEKPAAEKKPAPKKAPAKKPAAKK
jgi:hypothetical protein